MTGGAQDLACFSLSIQKLLLSPKDSNSFRYGKGANVEVTGAARLYREASVWTAGLAVSPEQYLCNVIFAEMAGSIDGRVERSKMGLALAGD